MKNNSKLKQKLKVSANSFGQVAKNRSKLETWLYQQLCIYAKELHPIYGAISFCTVCLFAYVILIFREKRNCAEIFQMIVYGTISFAQFPFVLTSTWFLQKKTLCIEMPNDCVRCNNFCGVSFFAYVNLF